MKLISYIFRTVLVLCFTLLVSQHVCAQRIAFSAQTKAGPNAPPLQINSTTGGLRPTCSSTNAIKKMAAKAGTLVYDTTVNMPATYNGQLWQYTDGKYMQYNVGDTVDKGVIFRSANNGFDMLSIEIKNEVRGISPNHGIERGNYQPMTASFFEQYTHGSYWWEGDKLLLGDHKSTEFLDGWMIPTVGDFNVIGKYVPDGEYYTATVNEEEQNFIWVKVAGGIVSPQKVFPHAYFKAKNIFIAAPRKLIMIKKIEIPKN